MIYLQYSNYLVTGNPFVSIIEDQENELKRLRAMETAVKKILNDDQIRMITTGKRVVYDHQTIQDAVMHYAQLGSTNYEYVREKMELPIPALSTIRKHLQGVESGTGILKDFFTMMKPKMEKITDQRHKKFGLLADQVALEPKKELDMGTGKIIGYPTMAPNQHNRKRNWKFLVEHDYSLGVNSTENLATHALCWMIVSLDGPR